MSIIRKSSTAGPQEEGRHAVSKFRRAVSMKKAVKDRKGCNCSSPKAINSGVPQGSVLSHTLFLLFINDLLSSTTCPIHSYADDSTLHYSISFTSRPSQQSLQASSLDAAERLSSDLSIIFNWGKRNLVSFNASKTQFLHLSTRHNLPITIPSSSTTLSFLLPPQLTFLAYPLLTI